MLPLAIIGLRMVPAIVIAFPLFLVFAALHWVDRYYALTLLYTALTLPYVIWVMRSYVARCRST